jgi:hypothetical protein
MVMFIKSFVICSSFFYILIIVIDRQKNVGWVVSISDLNSDVEIKFSKLIHRQVPQIAGLQGIYYFLTSSSCIACFIYTAINMVK